MCGSTAANLVKLRTLEGAELLTQKDVLKAAGKIPQESHHCALLAANTLKAAIAGYRAK
jgi:NifU-like protein involved in Fe-S cluster formation